MWWEFIRINSLVGNRVECSEVHKNHAGIRTVQCKKPPRLTEPKRASSLHHIIIHSTLHLHARKLSQPYRILIQSENNSLTGGLSDAMFIPVNTTPVIIFNTTLTNLTMLVPFLTLMIFTFLIVLHTNFLVSIGPNPPID